MECTMKYCKFGMLERINSINRV